MNEILMCLNVSAMRCDMREWEVKNKQIQDDFKPHLKYSFPLIKLSLSVAFLIN